MFALSFRSAQLAVLLAIGGLAAPALAGDGGPQARLRQCGPRACLLIKGWRADPRATVRIADHPVAVQGGHVWRTTLALDQVREWSAPFARSIAVRIDGPDVSGSDRSVQLPIGLLGHVTELAALEISAP